MSVGRVAIVVLVFACAISVRAADEHERACFQIADGIEVRGEEARTSICANEIDGLMKAPMSESLEWPKYKNQGSINNCSDYLSVVGYGKYWLSRNELGMERPYLRTCGLLVALRGATLGRRVFPSSSDALSLTALPPTIAYPAVTADAQEELERLANEHISARDLVAERGSPAENGVVIELIAIADIDADGYSDYIVSRSWRCVGDCSDSSYHVGFLSPRRGQKLMTWFRFDEELKNLPNKPPQRTRSEQRASER